MHTNDAPRSTMYGFLACTAQQFMTRDVKTVTRQTTIRELSELFEKHDLGIVLKPHAHSAPIRCPSISFHLDSPDKAAMECVISDDVRQKTVDLASAAVEHTSRQVR